MTSNAAGFDFSQFVPGFDFLRQMAQPRTTLPSAAQWVAPTVDPDEVERRIQELKTVLFWLEQNSTALKATIQALEVQKLTLTTLQAMNLGLSDMASSMLQQTAAHGLAGMDQAAQDGDAGAAGGSGCGPAAGVPQAQAEAAKPDTPNRGAGDGVDCDQQPANHSGDSSQKPDGDAEQPESSAQTASSLDQAFTQAGQWWGSMLQTFQAIAQQAQHDVQARHDAFGQTQGASKPAQAPRKRSRKQAQPSPDAPVQETAKAATPPPRAGAAGQRTRSSTKAQPLQRASAKPAAASSQSARTKPGARTRKR